MDRKSKKEIADAIRRAESLTSGEIRVHLKKKCSADVLTEAKKVFMKLGMHRTREHNAVLIFAALGSRRFAILGDKGIDAKVGVAFWGGVCDRMAAHFTKDRIKEALLEGVSAAGEKLKEYFPLQSKHKNELSDEVTAD